MKRFHVLVLMEWYDHLIREGIGRWAAEHHWILTVNDGCMLPRGWSGDGILTLLSTRNDMIRYLKSQNVPCVDFGAFRPDIALPRVHGDHEAIGRLAADHFIERGFTHTAFFSTEYLRAHRLRQKGFVERFRERTGVSPCSLVWAETPDRLSDDWSSMNQWLARHLQALPKPLAVFCYCDYDAAKVEAVCQEYRLKIPEDVAILGVDNDTLVCENLEIPLSSVRHNLRQVGYRGAELLQQLMCGGKAPANPVLIPPSGIESRGSTNGFAVPDRLTRTVVQFFQAHLSESIGVQDAAAAVNLTPQRLEEHFRAAIHRHVYATLLELRLSEARRLLRTTRLPVKTIALRTGFCHAQHLSNIFKATEHMTPTAFRKREQTA